ncbi:MAG: anthranilate synthase component II [Thermodesulfobacteriota bacterium]
MPSPETARLLVIDNYDSFTYNLVQMFRQYPLDIRVYRCDRLTLETAENYRPDYVLISPGPKDPQHTGVSVPIIHAFCHRIPILGVCLGMQCINAAFGGATVRAPLPVHGKTSLIRHEGRFLFHDLPSPFRAARYHSLMVRPRNDELTITAESEDGVIMGLSHLRHPLHGVQFHPESFLTEYGFRLVENFLRLGPLARPEKQRRPS